MTCLWRVHQNETRLNAGLMERETYYMEQNTNLPKIRQMMIISSIPLRLLTYPSDTTVGCDYEILLENLIIIVSAFEGSLE